MAQTRALHLAEGLDLPLDAITEKIAFIGRTGSGKTWGAGRFAEQVLQQGAQLLVIDGIGVWWGLRTLADGKSPGFAIPVFGGDHGDVPLDPKAGALVADLVVGKACSAVLDVSHLRKGQRKEFVTDFAEQFFHKKKTHRTPVHIVIEEAQMYIPQHVHKGEERMLGAWEDIIKLGRNYGIGTSIIGQRPQAIHKDCLNQAEILVVFQLVGQHERKAVREWIAEKEVQGVDIDAVKALPVGTAFVWSPQLLKILGRYKIAKKTTLDVSRTPRFGDRAQQARTLAPVELAEIRTAMAQVIERAEGDDPVKLKKRIVELERALQRHGTAVPAVPKQVTVAVPIVPKAVVTEARRLSHQVQQAKAKLIEIGAQVDGLHSTVEALTQALAGARTHDASNGKAIALPPGVSNPASGAPVLAPFHFHKDPAAVHEAVTQPRVRRPVGGSGTERLFGSGPSKMLGALAGFHPRALTRRQVATLAVLSPNTGTFRNYLSELRGAGFIVTTGELVNITEDGIAYAKQLKLGVETEDLVGLWSTRVSGTAAKMLKLLHAEHPNAYTREALAAAVEISHETGTFRNYLSELRSNGLVVTSGDRVVASDALFM